MKRLALLVSLVALAIVGYGQTQRKYQLPAPEEPKEEKAKTGSFGSLLKTVASAATATLGITQEKVSLQEVSNSLHAFENSSGGSWMKEARKALGKTTDAVQLYMVNDEGAYLYEPTTRSLNLVAEGDFRAQVLEGNNKYEGAKVVLLAGETLESFAKEQLRGSAGKLLGEGEEKTETATEEGATEEESYPKTFSLGKVFVFLGAKQYVFN